MAKEFDDQELPWTEAQWEAFMRRSDVRSAKFGELLETLHDDPDRHAKIDHEMGWDKPIEGETEEDEEAARRVDRGDQQP